MKKIITKKIIRKIGLSVLVSIMLLEICLLSYAEEVIIPEENVQPKSNVLYAGSEENLSIVEEEKVINNLPKEVQEAKAITEMQMAAHSQELAALLKQQEIYIPIDLSSEILKAQVGNWQKDEIDGKMYFILPNGEKKKGWQEINNEWYYLDIITGEMLTGVKIIDGRVYYFEMMDGAKKPKGQMYKNEMTPTGCMADVNGDLIGYVIPIEYYR